MCVCPSVTEQRDPSCDSWWIAFGERKNESFAHAACQLQKRKQKSLISVTCKFRARGSSYKNKRLLLAFL